MSPVILLTPALIAVQSPAAEIHAGDQVYVSLDAPAALAHYERALALDSTSYEAAWKASRSAADLELRARGDATRHVPVPRKVES